MTSINKPPGRGDGDDPWAKLARENRAAATGETVENLEAGDTDSALRATHHAGEQAGPNTEILELVNDSLEASPERGDLWMMRFDVQRTLGLREEFAKALIEAWRNARLVRQINWVAVRQMWEEMAPGEPIPGNIWLPDATSAPGALPTAARTVPESTAARAAQAPRTRRFSDIAQQVAGRELAVLSKAYAALQQRPGFFEDYARRVAPMLKRPTPLQPAETLMRVLGGSARILLKREDLRTVTPEEENAMAQAFLATQLGRPTVITGNDTDAHSLALARVAREFQLKCIIIVKEDDPQKKPKFIDELFKFDAQVEVMTGRGMLGSDPREAALRLWQKSIGSAHLALSLGTGPSPYPAMNHNFQSVLGRETELQWRAAGTARPRTLVAAVDSGADSIGFVLPSLSRKEIELVFAESDAAGPPRDSRLKEYNGARREHAWLKATGRIEHVVIPDPQARAAQQQVLAAEKISIRLEDARAVALASLLAQRDPTPRDFIVLVA